MAPSATALPLRLLAPLVLSAWRPASAAGAGRGGGAWESAGVRERQEGEEYDSWGSGCQGHWSPWARCSSQCYTTRRLSLSESSGCSEIVQNGQTQFAICNTDDCPLGTKEDEVLKGIHGPLFKDRVNSGQMATLGDVVRGIQVFGQILLFTSLAVLAVVQHFQVRWLPDMCAVIPVAAAFALFARVYTFDGVSFGPAANAVVGTTVSTVMNALLLPISIFDGAFHLQRRNFFSQFGYGILFSVVGTCMSCAMIAVMVKYTGDAGWHPVTSWREAIAYGAFIADTDPIATLSIFSTLEVDALLSTLVAAEATLNDPVALVIFNICNQHTLEFGVSIGQQVLSAIWLLLGSMALGAAMGVLLLAMLRCFRFRGKGPLEAVYFMSCAFTSYCSGEAAGMSGIIVTLFCGMFMGVYAPTLVEDSGAVSSLLTCTARLADIVIFIFIGASTFLIDETAGVKLGLLTIVFCLASRVIMVTCLVLLANAVKKFRGYETIGFGTAVMICHSGFRGGVTMMMALMLDPFWAVNQNTMVVGTIISVIGMAYLSGCTAPFLLRLLRVPTNVPQEDGALFEHSSGPASLLDCLHQKFGKLLFRGLSDEGLPVETSTMSNMAPTAARPDSTAEP